MLLQNSIRRLGYFTTVSGVLALLVTGCAAADEPPSLAEANGGSAEAPEEMSESLSGQDFVEAFENEGLECAAADKKRWGSGVVDQINCKGDDYVRMTIRKFSDPAARDAQLVRVQKMACEIAKSGQETQRLTTSGTWIVMAGGDRDVDFEIFGDAMTGLGLDWFDTTCQK